MTKPSTSDDAMAASNGMSSMAEEVEEVNSESNMMVPSKQM